MAESELNNFVFWYLNSQGYDETLKSFKKSVGVELEPKENISDKQIKNYEKILRTQSTAKGKVIK